jgi:hypothetical protein
MYQPKGFHTGKKKYKRKLRRCRLCLRIGILLLFKYENLSIHFNSFNMIGNHISFFLFFDKRGLGAMNELGAELSDQLLARDLEGIQEAS